MKHDQTSYLNIICWYDKLGSVNATSTATTGFLVLGWLDGKMTTEELDDADATPPYVWIKRSNMSAPGMLSVALGR